MHKAAKVRAKQPKAKVPNLIVDFAEQVLSRIRECDNAAGTNESRANQFFGSGVTANDFVQNRYVHAV